MTAKVEQLNIDKVLVARFKSGDHEAFEEMVTRYWDKIFARAFQLLKNHEDAEEVTQDTFIRAQKGLENFRGEASFSTWLYQIATNLAHNRYWYWWRRKKNSSYSIDQSFGEDNDTALIDILPADIEDPGEATLTQEFVDSVAMSMETLNPKHKEVLVLRNVKNLSYDEISEVLGINVGTVKSRIARARESLREKLGDDFK